MARSQTRCRATVRCVLAWTLTALAVRGQQSIAGIQAAGARVAGSAIPQLQASPPGASPPLSPTPPAIAPISAPGQQSTAQNNTSEPTPPAPAPGPSPAASDLNPDLEPLKIFQQGSRNIRQLQTSGFRGWIDSDDPCEGWTGITCNSQSRVTRLELGNWNLETRLPPELSGLTELTVMNLTGNNLLGGLPSNWGSASVFMNLTQLDLSNNPNLSGALPPNWGTQGAFGRLQMLSLKSTGVSGQLPLAWGGNLSLPSLQTLDLSHNILDGTLPAGWGTQGAFEKLQELHLGSNSLSGSLPTQWGAARNGIVFPSLLTVDLSNNSFSGYLPSGWGTGFQNVSTMSLGNNSLAGSLPLTWADSGRWQNLSRLELQRNMFTGSIPSEWGNWSVDPLLTLVVLPGNSFCGDIPGSLAGRVVAVNGSQIPVNGLGTCSARPPSPLQASGGAPVPVPTISRGPGPVPARAPAPVPVSQQVAPAKLAPAPAPVPVPVPQPSVAAPTMPSASLLPPSAFQPLQYVPVPAPKPAAEVVTPPVPPPAQSPAPIPAPTVAAPTVFVPTGATPSPVPGIVAGLQTAPTPGPSVEQLASILARYNLTGPDLASGNETVQRMVLSAMRNTLVPAEVTSVQLLSLTPITAAGRKLLVDSSNVQATFLINTTSVHAPGLVQALNSSDTETTFGQQLGLAGLPYVQPALQEARITDPLITNPNSPIPSPPVPSPLPVPVAPAATSSSSSLSGGAIGGIVAGVLIAALAVALVACWRVRKRRRSGKDAETGGKLDSPTKSPRVNSTDWLRFWSRASRASDSSSSSGDEGAVGGRAARIAAKNRKPQPDSPVKQWEPEPPASTDAVAKGSAQDLNSVASVLSTADSFEREERHTVLTIPGSPPSPFQEDADKAFPPCHPTIDEEPKPVGNPGFVPAMSLPGSETPPSERLQSEASPPSDHTAMTSEIVPLPAVLNDNSGFTSGSSSEGRRKVPVASSSRRAAEAMQRIDEKRETRAQPGMGHRSGSGSGLLSGKDTQAGPSPASRSRSSTLLRALERELRTSQQAPPSSYSRRHMAGEAQVRQPGRESYQMEKREVPSGSKMPPSEAIRRNLDALEALERKHGGGKAGADTAKLRAEVEQILGQGGYLKRADDEKAPPPSYHRRLAEEGRTSSGLTASGSLSRPGSGLLSSRQGSAALSSRPSGGLDSSHRASGAQGHGRGRSSRDRLARTASGSGSRSLEPTPRGEAKRPSISSGTGEARPGERRSTPRVPMSSAEARGEEARLLRRQQSSQREVMLRDLERQLGLEAPPPPAREQRADAQRREQRSDQRREIAQRARRLLEEMGGVDSPANKHGERGSRRSKQKDETLRDTAARPSTSKPQ